MRPNKSLGQNFLTSRNIAQKIVNTLEIQDNDLIIEIGAGKGALTEFLVKRNGRFIAIELDKRAIEILTDKFSQNQNLRIINKDIREISFIELFNENKRKKIKVIGNLPYYLSSEILFTILENKDYIEQVVIMIQKEVARRILAKPNNKEYGILSIATTLLSNVEYKFDVTPGNFFPKPKVFSSVIKLTLIENSIGIDEYHWIMKIVKQAFNQRRKILKNSLNALLTRELSIDIERFIDFAYQKNFDKFDLRAENLSPEEFIILSKLIKEYINQVKSDLGQV